MTPAPPAPPLEPVPDPPALPPGVLCVRLGPGANCSSAGSAIDVLFYGSVVLGALAVALAAAIPPGGRRAGPPGPQAPDDGAGQAPLHDPSDLDNPPPTPP